MNQIETALAKNKNAGFTLELLSPRYLLTWTGILILKLSTFLPYELLMKIGNIMGNLVYKVSPTRAEIVKINIEKCLAVKGEELENLVKLNFQSLGRGIFEMAYAWWASDKKIRNLPQIIINEDLLKNSGTGALVLIKHSTHLELDLRILSCYFDLTGMYKLQTNKVINHMMIRSRDKYIKGSVVNNEVLKAVRWVKEGKRFLYAADQDYGEKVSTMIPFFKSPAATVRFPAMLSRKNVNVVMADVSKIEKNYVVELISLKNLQDDEDFLKQMNILYEECIKKEPEGYLWMHRRFKSGLTNSIYPKLVRREKKRAKKRAKRN